MRNVAQVTGNKLSYAENWISLIEFGNAKHQIRFLVKVWWEAKLLSLANALNPLHSEPFCWEESRNSMSILNKNIEGFIARLSIKSLKTD